MGVMPLLDTIVKIHRRCRVAKQINLVVSAISCSHCAMTIRRELAEVAGVSVVDVDVPAKVVTLEVTDETALARAEALLAEIGYPAERVAA
jgi:copper chaperone